MSSKQIGTLVCHNCSKKCHATRNIDLLSCNKKYRTYCKEQFHDSAVKKGFTPGLGWLQHHILGGFKHSYIMSAQLSGVKVNNNIPASLTEKKKVLELQHPSKE